VIDLAPLYITGVAERMRWTVAEAECHQYGGQELIKSAVAKLLGGRDLLAGLTERRRQLDRSIEAVARLRGSPA